MYTGRWSSACVRHLWQHKATLQHGTGVSFNATSDSTELHYLFLIIYYLLKLNFNCFTHRFTRDFYMQCLFSLTSVLSF